MATENSKPTTPKATPPVDATALLDPSIPKIYANGFSLGLTNADAQLVLMLFGRPITVLSLSYTLTKTLSEKLTSLVNDWEKKTGHVIETTDSIEKAFSLHDSEEGKK
jgi:hypothetical protein